MEEWGTMQRHCSFSLALFWITHAGGSQSLCHEDTQETLWRGPRGKELSPSANSQHQLVSHAGEPSWKQISSPRKP